MASRSDNEEDMDLDDDGGGSPIGASGQGIGYALADLDDDEIDEDYVDDEDDDDGEYFDEDDEDMMEEDDEDDDDDEPGIMYEVATDDELEGGGDDDEDDNEGGMTLAEIAALLNASSAPGTNTAARQSIIARILSGASGGSINLRSGNTAARRQAPTRDRKRQWWTPQKEPHPKGVELLRSGEFGGVGDWEWSWRSSNVKRQQEGQCNRMDKDGRMRRPRGMSRGAGNGPGLAVKKMSRVSLGCAPVLESEQVPLVKIGRKSSLACRGMRWLMHRQPSRTRTGQW